ncbi:MAG: hypothetical protein HY362_03915 [Candidatus Aenigmarchaeota archaeon]|nr:hypothetical protein [Candidatus Aenigmarchaeota archaeon]
MFNLEELEKDRKINRLERRKFIDLWIDFMEKNPNYIWSRQHADFVDMVYGKK